MLPTNVVSFMKKMVTSEGVGGGGGGGQPGYHSSGTRPGESGTTLSKLKHTLTSGLTGTVTKLSPTKPATNVNPEGSLSSSSSSSSAGIVLQSSAVSSEDRSLLQKVWDRSERFDPTDPRMFKPPPISTPTAPSVGVLGSSAGGVGVSPLTSPVGGRPEGGPIPMPMRPGRSPGSSCRVCVKTLGESEFFKVCSECGNKVCEDCASYSQSKTEGEETWNCSICRRRLSSRAKTEKPPSSEGLTPGPMPSPLPPPSPGAPTALNLFSGLAAMASSMAVAQPQQQASAPTAAVPTFATVSSGVANPLNTTPSTPTSLEMPTANGYTRRRSVWSINPQKSLDNIKLLERAKAAAEGAKEPKEAPKETPKEAPKETPKEAPKEASREGSKEGPNEEPPHKEKKMPLSLPPEGRRQRDRSRDRSSGPRRRPENDEDHPRSGPRTPHVRHRRMSDYRLRDAEDGEGGLGGLKVKGGLHSAKSELDISRPSRRASCVNLQLSRPLDSGGGGGGRKATENGISGEDMHEKYRSRGRRKSIRRQQSYEEEHEKENMANAHKNSLAPWEGGELPQRRHSMQGPTRRKEALEAQRDMVSLDVPQQRGSRHVSGDSDISKDTLPIGSSAGSRLSSDSDLSSDAPSERGSTNALEDEGNHYSRSSRRRSSYRASRVKNHDSNKNHDGDDHSGHRDSSQGPLAQEVASAADGGNGATSGQTSRRSGSSNLEEERRDTRRRGSAVYDTGRRASATPPVSRDSHQSSAQNAVAPSTGVSAIGRERKARITQSLEVNTSRDLGMDGGPQRQNSVSDAETIRIVIHDVDLEHKKAKDSEKGRRRVTVKRDMTDPGHRTRGLGMRVVGGKVGSDGRLFAYVVWTVRGGTAHAAGVVKGDKVLEWNGVELTDRSFEEVCSIMEEVNPKMDTVELLLESSNDLSLDYADETSALNQPKKGSLEARSPSDPESDVLPSTSSIRRKLPQIPGDLIREPVSGKLQIQLWYEQDKSHLIATVVSAHDLRFRDSSTCYPPEAFVCLRLYPFNDSRLFSTGVAESSCKPLWNSSFIWEGLSGDLLLGLTLELTVYDYMADTDSEFLGETLIDLRHAYLDERPTWYRLQERRSRSANATPRGSLVSYDFTAPLLFQRRPSSARSGSEDVNDGIDSRSSSLDSGLLHPEFAYRESRSSSRRSSTFSEQDDNEEYQLSRRYPHSMPQSRRSSMSYTSNTSLEIKAEDLEARLAISMGPVERRRSHSFRTSGAGEFLVPMEELQRPRRASSHSILTRSSSGRTPIDPRVWKDVYVMS